MKKQYFMMAIAATMFAACSQNEIVDEVVESTPKAIGFTTYAEGQTRAENSQGQYNWNLEDHHKTFNVWAYKNVSNTKVFNGDVVTHNGTWGYDNTRYWDKAATSYEFYAAAPNGFNWVLNTNDNNVQNDDYFTLEDYELVGDNFNTTAFTDEPTKSFITLTTDKDLMIADKKNVANANFYKDVQLQFIHILSRLNVTIKKEGIKDEDKVHLVSLEVYNLNNKGNFKEEEITDNTQGHIRWTTNKTTPINYRYVGNQEVETTAKYAIQALVLPQEVAFESVELDGDGINLATSKPFIKIVYTITSGTNVETFAAYYNLANAFGATEGNISFCEGWQNILNITIKPTAIKFDATVAEWVFKYNKDLTIK